MDSIGIERTSLGFRFFLRQRDLQRGFATLNFELQKTLPLMSDNSMNLSSELVIVLCIFSVSWLN